MPERLRPLAALAARWRALLSRWHLYGALSTVLSLGSIGWGVTLFLYPIGMSGIPAFGVATRWASPEAWGAVAAILAICLLAASMTSPPMAVVPAALLSVVYGALTLAMVLASIEIQPAPTAAWVYATMSAISSVVAAASLMEKKRR